MRHVGSGPFQPGDILAGAYEIVGLLGRGAMGTVYDARDLLLPRHVAVKVVNASVHAPYLIREAQALAAIRHPGFVTLHHVGMHDDVPFMVMERLVGETLEARLAEKRATDTCLPVEVATRILISIAEALSSAHRAGVIHRDLKPANVFLCGDRVVLVDVGLFVPEVIDCADEDITGTAEYIAPEVVLGTLKKGDGALVDLYALGAVAFELLTNHAPYESSSIAAILANHVAAPVPDVRDRREVPEGLAHLISDLLSKNPKDRPASAEAVLWELKHSNRMSTMPPSALGTSERIVAA